MFWKILRPCYLSKLKVRSIHTNVPLLSHEHNSLKETTSKVCSQYLLDHVISIDQNDHWSDFRNFWLRLGEAGLLGVTVPEQYGGSELGYYEHCLVMEEISKFSGSIGLSYGAHSNLCVNQISRNGTHELKSRFLPKLTSGEYIGALAMSEVDAGSDVTSMRTFAEDKGDHYVLNGSKYWITNGMDADVTLVYAKTSKESKNNMTCFVVERGTKGFTQNHIKNKLGMRGSLTAELVFENCIIPKENVLGDQGKGVYVLMSGLDYERLVLSAGPLGMMRAAIDVSFKYAHERKTFGKIIGEHQLIQGKMAEMYVRLVTSKCFVYEVAKAVDQGSCNPLNCASVILYAAESATQVALDAVQLQGGAGYINDNLAAIILRDSKLLEIGAGTTEIRKWLIGREINKLMS